MTFTEFQQFMSQSINVSIDDISENSIFRDDLGVDSLQMINLIIELAQRFNLELGAIKSADDMFTVGNMYRAFKKG